MGQRRCKKFAAEGPALSNQAICNHSGNQNAILDVCSTVVLLVLDGLEIFGLGIDHLTVLINMFHSKRPRSEYSTPEPQH